MDKDILSIKEVAEYMGLGTGAIHGFIRKRGMPVFRIGRKIMKVRKEDLLNWISKHVIGGKDNPGNFMHGNVK